MNIVANVKRKDKFTIDYIAKSNELYIFKSKICVNSVNCVNRFNFHLVYQ